MPRVQALKRAVDVGDDVLRRRAARSPRRRPASGRTRCRCAPSSRSGRRRPRPACTKPSSRGPSGRSASKTGIARSTSVLVAADHQAVAVVETPDAAGHAAVEVADALARRAASALRDVVGEARVAALDDEVALARAGSPSSSTTAAVGAPDGTMTQTIARRGQRLDQLRERRRRR